jgi:hypothetical protein
MTKRRTLLLLGGGCLAAGAQTTSLRTERITLKLNGFDPSAVTLAPGRVMLLLDDRSRLKNNVIQFDAVAAGGAAARLGNFEQGLRGKVKFRETLDLRPGEYELSVPGKSGWKCRITVR